MVTATATKTASQDLSRWPTLTGRQEPYHLTMTKGDLAEAQKVVTLGERAGLYAMPWQHLMIEGICSRTAAGTWTHSTVCIIVPRQNGKSAILSLIVLYRLFLRGERIIFTAQQWKTAEELWQRTWGLVEGRQWLKKMVKRKTCSQGRGTIELKSGASVVFTTRSADAGRGQSDVDTLIYDEAYNLTSAEQSALAYTQLKAKDPQVIFTSSAVNKDIHPNGAELAAIRERGLEGDDPSIFFAEWMAPEDMDREDPATWRFSNPSYGVIQTEKKLLAIMRNQRTPEGRKSFDVEALGRGDWPIQELTEDDPLVIDLDHWASLVDRAPEVTGEACLAVDFSNDVADRKASVAIAVPTKRGRHVQLGYHGPANVPKVVEFIKQCVEKNDLQAVVIDPRSAAEVLIKPLTDAGIEPELMSAKTVASATAEMLQNIDDEVLTHDEDNRLTAAIEVARLREIGDGGIAWTRRKSGGPISQLIAVTNASWGLGAFGAEPVPQAPAFANSTPAALDLSDNFGQLAW